MTRYVPGQRWACVWVGTRGRITIPKAARDALGWQPCDEIVVCVEGTVCCVVPRGFHYERI